MKRPHILFAPGAGASSSSPWMLGWSERLASLGDVRTFDYPYRLAGKKLPDRHPVLLDAHLAQLDQLAAETQAPIILAGKSMGGRMACHAAVERQVTAIICMGYPLRSPSGKMRDEVLFSLKTPVLFVQGTRDKLCPLGLLDDVRTKMTCQHTVHVVDNGDHSLLATKTWLKKNESSQHQIDSESLAAIAAFLDRVLVAA